MAQPIVSARAQANARGVGIVLAAILGLALLSLLFAEMGGDSVHKRSHHLTTKALIQEAAQWSTVAQQDNNPLLALVHATYATAYLNVARRMSSDADIEGLASIHVAEFSKALNSSQQASMRALLAQCPVVAPAGIAALQTGWMA